MPNPNISAALTPADKAAILGNITNSTGLLPFLVNLSPDERHDKRKVATKREGLVASVYTACISNPTAIPATFSMTEWTKDESLVTDLKEIRASLLTFAEGLDDTILALGNERIQQAETALGFLEAAARGNAALNTIVQQIKTAYAGQGTQQPLPVISVPPAAMVTIEGGIIGKLVTNKGLTVLAMNKAGSTNVATLINIDPGTAIPLPDGYKNFDIRNLSPSAEGAFTVKTK
jgi:hypothetical protein